MLLITVLALMTTAACGGGSLPGKPGTEESQPSLSIETPIETSLLLPFRVSGWAIDRGSTSGAGVERVEVLDGGCNGQLLGRAESGIRRPDIAADYGERFMKSGWQFVVDRLNVGEHVLAVRLYSALSHQPVCKTATVSVL